MKGLQLCFLPFWLLVEGLRVVFCSKNKAREKNRNGDMGKMMNSGNPTTFIITHVTHLFNTKNTLMITFTYSWDFNYSLGSIFVLINYTSPKHDSDHLTGLDGFILVKRPFCPLARFKLFLGFSWWNPIPSPRTTH